MVETAVAVWREMARMIGGRQLHESSRQSSRGLWYQPESDWLQDSADDGEASGLESLMRLPERSPYRVIVPHLRLAVSYVSHYE